MKSDVLKLFRTAIDAVDPYTCVKHHLVFNNHSNNGITELHIGNNHIILDHNLYIAAFGKAAIGMCRAVDELFHEHIIKGIASVPVGAEHNLPDQAAMNTAQHIQTMISNTMCADDIFLVLISGDIL
ncbi:unnamed protein product [Rotaria sp. Silwood1]|nr:unnamed protein product [Rotaria sp. Silwood1]CAF1164087.1 unnamed protein product [Rotaria sp. Silwood1]CAF1168518.1 unnamed protein product [Rotaria sp. Silwood1]CAF3433648.1 unnamed protein product [Rotaria sp. Silwood1]CAF3459903.1 unnamed protein product [Rotaria sp. Silwood1]